MSHRFRKQGNREEEMGGRPTDARTRVRGRVVPLVASDEVVGRNPIQEKLSAPILRRRSGIWETDSSSTYR